MGASTSYLGIALRYLHLRPGILIAVIVRGQEIIIPEGSSHLQAGDNVIIISRNNGILDLNDIYQEEKSVPGTVGGAQ